MKKVSRRFVAMFIILSCLLAVAGASFGYFVTIPAALNFLATFAGDAVTPSLTADSYLSFVVTYVLGLAVLFQLPLLLFLMDNIRPFPPGSLGSSQRFVIIGATVIAAIITPTPDAFNMAVVAVPIVIIYEVGVIAVLIRHRLMSKSVESEKIMDAAVLAPQDEPLTAIVEDLKQYHQSAPLVDGVEPIQQRMQPQTFRTIDGIIVTRKAPATVTVPPRSGTSVQLASGRMSQPRPLRSANGFSMG
jgi:hypothetical protein